MLRVVLSSLVLAGAEAECLEKGGRSSRLENAKPGGWTWEEPKVQLHPVFLSDSLPPPKKKRERSKQIGEPQKSAFVYRHWATGSIIWLNNNCLFPSDGQPCVSQSAFAMRFSGTKLIVANFHPKGGLKVTMLFCDGDSFVVNRPEALPMPTATWRSPTAHIFQARPCASRAVRPSDCLAGAVCSRDFIERACFIGGSQPSLWDPFGFFV